MDDYRIEAIHFHYGKIIKWLIIGWAVTTIVLCGMFMYERSQWVTVDSNTEESVDVDAGEGIANYIGNNGGIFNDGENNSYEAETHESSDAQE